MRAPSLSDKASSLILCRCDLRLSFLNHKSHASLSCFALSPYLFLRASISGSVAAFVLVKLFARTASILALAAAISAHALAFPLPNVCRISFKSFFNLGRPLLHASAERHA